MIENSFLINKEKGSEKKNILETNIKNLKYQNKQINKTI